MKQEETQRANRYRVIRQTVRELKAKLNEHHSEAFKNREVIASTERTLAIFRKEAAFIEAEIQLETDFEAL